MVGAMPWGAVPWEARLVHFHEEGSVLCSLVCPSSWKGGCWKLHHNKPWYWVPAQYPRVTMVAFKGLGWRPFFFFFFNIYLFGCAGS